MVGIDFNPAKFAADMQLRTRKQNDFDKFEAQLPDPQSPALQTAAHFSISEFITQLGRFNPFGKPVIKGDIVWLFDNTAFQRSEDEAAWQAEFIAAVFEGRPNCKVADIVASVANLVGLADDAAERKTIEERIMPFLWDIKVARIVEVAEQGRGLKLGPTSLNGISNNVLGISKREQGAMATIAAQVPHKVDGILEMKTHYAGTHGWAIISDIDDTIKITQTSSPTGILRKTFVDPPAAVEGMPELYSEIKSLLPEDTPWFYLSASPYNLYPFLRQFRDEFYPSGTMVLRDFSWRTLSGLLSALTLGTEEYKVDRMKKINGWLPNKKLIVFGDSTQSDPEAYGEIYRTIPGWIQHIFIRKVTDIAAVGMKEKNDPERFEKAFTDIPKSAWHVFEEPTECSEIIKGFLSEQ